MEAKIKELLAELYEVDPTLQKREPEIMKIIKKLLKTKPVIQMDKAFKERLRKEIARRLKRKPLAFLPLSRLSLAASVLSVLLLVVGVFWFSGMFTKSSQGLASAVQSKEATVNKPSGAPGIEGRTESEYREKADRRGVLGEFAPPVPLEAEKDMSAPQFNTEEYDRIYENGFLSVLSNPLSTFSIDVDTASYANVRRFIQSGQLPPPDAVRIEELINYFSYDYPQPGGGHPFAFTTETADCPWQSGHKLVLIGIQGERVDLEDLPPANLVFLLDVSGSMDSPDKLPLVKEAMKLVVKAMRAQDSLAIVVYAGAAGLVLPPTKGTAKDKILAALDELQAGGATAGGEGIRLAYSIAQKYFNPKGNNRVILATDGDFNVGPSSDAELVRLVEEQRKTGVYLTVLGFGTGNYKDAKMEQLADKGNGNFAYIDSLLEAKKVLVTEMGGTLYTIAKDVKIQIEFNPAQVKEYRLIGYENRLLAKEDFADDTKDAGELGAGHTLTVLYEIIMAGSEESLSRSASDLKYQDSSVKMEAYQTGEMLILKFRYKKPTEETSLLIEVPVYDDKLTFSASSENLRFASAVAMWGMLLRNSEFKGNSTYDLVLKIAANALGKDQEGYRAEFLKLVQKSSDLAKQ